jgi:hypothetical protein
LRGTGTAHRSVKDDRFSLKEALACLTDAADEMDRRYEILLQEGLTKLSDRFALGKKDIPFYILIFDEFADLVHSGRDEKKGSRPWSHESPPRAGRRASISSSRPNVPIGKP